MQTADRPSPGSPNKRAGENHPAAKLTDHEVGLVWDLLDTGMSLAEIAEKFDVSKSCIQHIASGRNRSAGWSYP